jgi:hypothetical protein
MHGAFSERLMTGKGFEMTKTTTKLQCWNCIGDGCSACGYQTPRVEAMTRLTMKDDGVNAIDLGVIGPWQYAVDFMGTTAANVWRRTAAEAGTYGGWRFECGSHVPGQYRQLPEFVALACRLDDAIGWIRQQ